MKGVVASVVKEFSDFLETYEKDIFSFCLYLAINKNDAEDLYQDTVSAAIESMGKIDAAKNPKSYMFSIAVGKWKNARRKAMRRDAIAPVAEAFDFGSIPGREDVQAAAEKGMLQSAIAGILRRMDDKFRIPIILCYFDDRSVEEIARICKIPKGTVKSRLHKGRELMRRELAGEGWCDV